MDKLLLLCKASTKHTAKKDVNTHTFVFFNYHFLVKGSVLLCELLCLRLELHPLA